MLKVWKLLSSLIVLLDLGLSRVDSLVESVYNSEKNLHWRNYKPDSRDRLYPTEASDEEFDIFHKSDTEDET